MKKIKVSEATGPVLDWMVGMALWGEVEIATFGPLFGKGHKAPCIKGRTLLFDPHSDWRQGGPIIEREEMTLKPEWDGEKAYWTAISITRFEHYRAVQSGPTLLIAAMRCFVASKLGEAVEVPEELL